MNLIEEIVKLRLHEPTLPHELASSRRLRSHWQRDKMVIVAMDHPARRVVAARGEAFAMADRAELLRRIAAVLMQPGVDGLLATPDVLEEVLLLNHVVQSMGGPNFVDGKVLVGSMNRGGLAGTAFELSDPVTAYTAQAISEMHLDAGKLLFRLYPDNRDSLRTMEVCVDALNDLALHNLPCFLEPLTDTNSTDDLVKVVGVASAMGMTSARRWLKLPMVDGMERIAGATTCPIVLLGGGAPGTSDSLLTNVARAMASGPNVRGLMIGRGVLFPSDDAKPEGVASELAAIVHGKKEEVVTWEGLTSTF